MTDHSQVGHDGGGRVCGGCTGTGEPCRSTILLPSGLCHAHDPTRAESFALARRMGSARAGDLARLMSRVKQTTAPADLPACEPDSLEHVSEWLQWTARSVATGEIDARTAREIVGACKELRPVLVNLGYERRLKAYERAIAAWKRSGKPDALFSLLEREGLAT